MEFDARHSIDTGLRQLAGRLDPIIAMQLKPSLGGLPWTTVLTELDRMRGKAPKAYAVTDLQAQLKALTERLGQLGFPFDNHHRLVSTLGSELRIMRNRWAHHDEMTTLDAWRTHDFAIRLLEHFGDEEGVRSASVLRDEAFRSMVQEQGAGTEVPPELPPPAEDTTGKATSKADEDVRPDPEVLTRGDSAGTPTIGSGRYEFEAWIIVRAGEPSVLQDLRRKVAKEQVRAVATEIAEFEGPIQLSRLVRLTAASFGAQRVTAARAKQVGHQIKQTKLFVDQDKFVWPTDLDPDTWREFRPNGSEATRSWTEISPREIANAMRLLRDATPGISDAALDAATLRTFGRKRRTKQIVAHLDRARSLL